MFLKSLIKFFKNVDFQNILQKPMPKKQTNTKPIIKSKKQLFRSKSNKTKETEKIIIIQSPPTSFPKSSFKFKQPKIIDDTIPNVHLNYPVYPYPPYPAPPIQNQQMSMPQMPNTNQVQPQSRGQIKPQYPQTQPNPAPQYPQAQSQPNPTQPITSSQLQIQSVSSKPLSLNMNEPSYVIQNILSKKENEDPDALTLRTPYINMLLSKKNTELPIEKQTFFDGILSIKIDNIKQKVEINEKQPTEEDKTLIDYFLRLLIIEKVSLDNRNLYTMFEQIQRYIKENMEKNKKEVKNLNLISYHILKKMTYNEITPVFFIKGVEDIHASDGNFVFVKRRSGDYQTNIDYKLKLGLDLRKLMEKTGFGDLITSEISCILTGEFVFGDLVIKELKQERFILKDGFLQVELKKDTDFDEDEAADETIPYKFKGTITFIDNLNNKSKPHNIDMQCKFLSHNIKYTAKKLAELCNKEISFNNKVIDGILPNNGRLALVYKCNSIDFNIRLPSSRIFSVVDLISYGMLDPLSAAYLWMIVESDFCKFMICGPTGSAKTTLLKAITAFIPKKGKIITIEDIPELDFRYHENWVQNITNVDAGVTMGKLLRSSLRRRPEYLMVGEIRSADECAVMLECFATGHKGISTIHVDSYESARTRLINSFNLDPEDMKEITMFVFLKVLVEGSRIKRYVYQIVETNKKDIYAPNVVFEWDGKHKRMYFTGKSILLGRYANRYGMSKEEVFEEIKYRANIIKFFVENDIKDHLRILDLVHLYKNNPKEFELELKRISEERKEQEQDLIESKNESIKKEEGEDK